MRIGGLAVVILIAAACGDNLKSKNQDAGIDAFKPGCGNGVVEGAEQCDDGSANDGPDARCNGVCNWVCTVDTDCADTEQCNGAETCVEHRCVAGTEQNDGVTCGTAKLCRNGSCTDAVCGDMFTTTPNEECDDANSTLGDGCENNCKYSCLSTDTARNCTPTDPCKGQGTCNDTTHVCAAGTPLADNTSCGTGKYCKTGVCTTAMCGNGMVEPGETCDLGTQNGMTGSGCKANCAYECVNAATDCATAAPACQMNTCNAAHTCAAVADTSKNGMTCGTNLVCSNGACVAPSAVCGNGVTETGEECDYGMGNGAGTGCESNCQFSCDVSADCNDGNLCNGTDSCTMVTVNNKPGKKCTTSMAPAQGTTCGTGKICLGQLCVTSTCGDGYTSTINGEQCDPPNATTCSATCQNIVCGDSVRAGPEQCDDGNTTNLDGCDGACKFEQCHRVNSLSMEFGTDAYCTANRLGAAIGTLAQGTIGSSLTNGVTDGSITIELLALGLDDLLGTEDLSMSLGILTGTPAMGANYNGTMDLDWWYTTSSTVINASRVPITQTTAKIMTKTLTAGPSDIAITISLGGTPATLNMLAAKLRANVGNSSVPTASTGSTPGHLASEHLNPTLQSFFTMTGGQLCGNVTAGSLAQVPIPSALLSNCTSYNATNSLLDVIVGGCSLGFIPIIIAKQPDTARGATLYDFTADATKHVNGCRIKGTTTPAPLATCLNDAAYSSSFKFTTDRVIAK
jgi:cysteine-rich repeat protein